MASVSDRSSIVKQFLQANFYTKGSWNEVHKPCAKVNASIQLLVVPVHIAFRPSFGSADGFWLHGYARLLVEMGEDEHQQQSCRGREAGSSSGSGLFCRFHNILPRKNLSHTANISQPVPTLSTFANIGQPRMEEDMLAQHLYFILLGIFLVHHLITACIPSSL
jgi:hypothetical protein